MATLDEIRDILLRTEQAVYDAVNKIQISGTQIVVLEGLSDIDNNLGLIRAGEFRSGKGIPGDTSKPFTGVRIGAPGWSYDGVRYSIVGLNNDVLQFGLSNEDGSVYAGEGSVQLDANGINIFVDAEATLSDKIKFFYGDPTSSVRLARIYAGYGGGPTDSDVLWMLAERSATDPWVSASSILAATDTEISTESRVVAHSSGNIRFYYDTYVWIDAQDRTGGKSIIDSMNVWHSAYTRSFASSIPEITGTWIQSPTWASDGPGGITITTKSASVYIDGNPDLTNVTVANNRNYALIVEEDMWVVAGGLNLHNGRAAGLGSMSYSGNLMAYRGSANYTGYIYVPLANVATSTAWDGNDTKTAGTYSIDTSSMFSLPAGVKAVNILYSGNWATASNNNFCAVRKKGSSVSEGLIRGVVANMSFNQNTIVSCDSNGDFDVVVAGADMTLAVLRVIGYFI